MPFNSKDLRPPPIATFYFDKLLTVSTNANFQQALPGLTARVCQAEDTSGYPFDGNAPHDPFPLLAGGLANKAKGSTRGWFNSIFSYSVLF